MRRKPSLSKQASNQLVKTECPITNATTRLIFGVHLLNASGRPIPQEALKIIKSDSTKRQSKISEKVR